MVDFGKRHIPGFKPDLGYGYFEFTQNEVFKPQKRKILVHKVSCTHSYQILTCHCGLIFSQDKRLFTGGGAQFMCANDEHNMDAILKNKEISPPDLTGTKWKHIFIQSYSKERELLPGTKFLYCEYKTYK